MYCCNPAIASFNNLQSEEHVYAFLVPLVEV